ncbi:hypothetical protein BDV95DRAFT_582307 [Massariosphaeria phaeospora]|uniref:Uncharacterized protein n=1 Tax=Massariosphaeria phaeospora TaxID=100035 RepID=A0A7C8M3X6_9PLEO|nr:hypothetical protein BDV95DRAFT_582307 [Massariosphaeria phaeospora]
MSQPPSYLLCAHCAAPAFTWLAAVFACPTCGSSRFKYPDGADSPAETSDDEGSEASREVLAPPAVDVREESRGRKRKRSG